MHDFEAQKEQTFDTFAAIASGYAVPASVSLDIHFFADDDADCDAARAALLQAGYTSSIDSEAQSAEVTVDLDNPTAERIWERERQITELLLPYGFVPDGWGFHLDPQPGFFGALAARVSGLFGRA